jgi:hypothetical protein
MPFQALKMWAAAEKQRLAVLDLQAALEQRAIDKLLYEAANTDGTSLALGTALFEDDSRDAIQQAHPKAGGAFMDDNGGAEVEEADHAADAEALAVTEAILEEGSCNQETAAVYVEAEANGKAVTPLAPSPDDVCGEIEKAEDHSEAIPPLRPSRNDVCEEEEVEKAEAHGKATAALDPSLDDGGIEKAQPCAPDQDPHFLAERPASAKTLRIQKLESQIEAALQQQSTFLQQSALSAEALRETTRRLEALADTAVQASAVAAMPLSPAPSQVTIQQQPSASAASEEAPQLCLENASATSEKASQSVGKASEVSDGPCHEHLAACGVLRARLASLLEPTEQAQKALAIERMKGRLGEYYALTCLQAKARCFNARRELIILRQDAGLRHRSRRGSHRAHRYRHRLAEPAACQGEDVSQNESAEPDQADNRSASSRCSGRSSHQKRHGFRYDDSHAQRPASVPALALDRVQFGEPVSSREDFEVLQESSGSTATHPPSLATTMLTAPEAASSQAKAAASRPQAVPPLMLWSTVTSVPALQEEIVLLSGSEVQLPMLSKVVSSPGQLQTTCQSAPARASGGFKRSPPAARRGISSSGGTKQHGQRSQLRRQRGNSAAGNIAGKGKNWQRNPPQCIAATAQSMSESRAHNMLLSTKAALTYGWPPMSKECHGHRPRPKSAPGTKALMAGSEEHIVYPLRPGRQVSAGTTDTISIVGGI